MTLHCHRFNLMRNQLFAFSGLDLVTSGRENDKFNLLDHPFSQHSPKGYPGETLRKTQCPALKRLFGVHLCRFCANTGTCRRLLRCLRVDLRVQDRVKLTWAPLLSYETALIDAHKQIALPFD